MSATPTSQSFSLAALCGVLLVLLSARAGLAQDGGPELVLIEQPQGVQFAIPSELSGQSFVASVSGMLTQLEFDAFPIEGESPLEIYEGLPGTGRLLHTTTVPDLGVATYDIVLAEPVRVLVDQTYSFVYKNAGFFTASLDNPYVDGTAFSGPGVAYEGYDLKFKITIEVGSNTSPAITGTAVDQLVETGGTILPFSQVALVDQDGDWVALSIQMDDYEKGVLSGTGLQGSGPYTLSRGAAQAVQDTLRTLVFTPAMGRTLPETTQFTLLISDGPTDFQDSETTVIHEPPPLSVLSITRIGEPDTSATSIDFTVLFSEDVSGVDPSDFELAAEGVTGHISNVSGSGSTYTVTVSSLSGEGAIRLDLRSIGTGITSNYDGEALTEGYAEGELQTVDTIAPSGYSMAFLDESIASNDDVLNVSLSAVQAGDDFFFSVNGQDEQRGRMLNSDQELEIDISDVIGNSVNLDLVMADRVGNRGETVSLSIPIGPSDPSPPILRSFELVGAPGPMATEVTYKLSFDKEPTGFSIFDFNVVPVDGFASGVITSAQDGPGPTILVTVAVVGTTASYGTIRLDLKEENQIRDEAGDGAGTNGMVSAAEGPEHEVTLPYDQTAGLNLRYSELDSKAHSNASPFKLRTGSIGILIPGLSQKFGNDQPAMMRLSIDPVNALTFFSEDGSGFWIETDYRLELSVLSNTYRAYARAVEFSGRLSLSGTTVAADSVLHPDFTALRVQTMTVDFSAVGPISTPALIFKLNLAAGGFAGYIRSAFSQHAFPINSAPAFSPGTDLTAEEDASTQESLWATGISPGTFARDRDQTLTFQIATDNDALFSTGPTLAADGTLSWTPAANAFGTANVSVQLRDDGGTGAGGVDSTATESFAITLNPVNDRPVISLPEAPAVSEDGTVVLGGDSAITISDVDGEEDVFEITLEATAAVSLGATAGISFLTGDGSDDLLMVFSGPLDAVNAALNGLTFRPDPDFFGPGIITVNAMDQGVGGGLVAVETLTFDVTPVNDAPSFTPGEDQTVDEDDGPQVVSAWATAISSGPVNESAQSLSFQLTTDNDVLFSVDPSIDAGGTLTWTPAPHAFGTATVSVQLMDDGGTEGGGADTSPTAVFTITVNPINDKPVVSIPQPPTVSEDGTLILDGESAISVSDVDGGEDLFEVTLAATSTLSLASTTGLTFAAGNGAEDPLMVFTGSLAAVNAALDGLTYRPEPDYFGPGSIAVIARDQGVGGSLAGVDTLHFQVTPVNDPPTFLPGGDQAHAEDAGPQEVALWATEISAGPANESDQSLSFQITTDNDALFSAAPAIDSGGTLTWTSAQDAFGSATVVVRLVDSGGTDDGGVDTAVATFTINVAPVDDPGMVLLPDPQFLLEGETLTLGGDKAIRMEDVDIGGDPIVVTLFGSAPMTLSTLEGLFPIVGDGVDDLDIGIYGPLPLINQALDGMTFSPGPDHTGRGTIAVVFSDKDSRPVDSATLVVTTTPVNDAPTFTAGQDQTVAEDAGPQTVANWATAVSPGPFDESGQVIHFQAATDNDALFSTHPAIDEDGTLTWTSAPDAFGVSTVSVRLFDDGGTENGGVDSSAVATFTITVTPVDDPPVVHLPLPQTVGEGAVLALEDTSAIWIEDIDIGDTEMIVRVGANAPMTLTSNDELTWQQGDALNGSTLLHFSGPLPYVNEALATLRYHAPADTPGSGYIELDATVSATSSRDTGSLPITITPVNDAPSFTGGPDLTALEDSGPQTAVHWAKAMSPGPPDESSQVITFQVATDNDALFSTMPAIDQDGTLTWTPAPDAFGSATVSVRLLDDGGTEYGGVDSSAVATMTITVNPVNDAPTLVIGPDVRVLEDAGPYGQDLWASSFSPGPLNESTQEMAFSLSTDNDALFSALPAVDMDGRLTFTSAPDANGTATVVVALTDNAPDSEGGPLVSVDTFRVRVTAVNDPPWFTPGGDVTVDEDAGPQSFPAWAAPVSSGPPNEMGQALSFRLEATGESIFQEAPAISPEGTLTFRTAPDAFGQALISVTVTDDGGTDSGGSDTSLQHQFVITVAPVNDPPSLQVPELVTVNEDEATVIDGALVADPDGTNLTMTLSATSGVQIDLQPGLAVMAGQNGSTTVSVEGPVTALQAALVGLTYVPEPDFVGLGSLTLQVSDGEFSVQATIQVQVQSVNDPPVTRPDAAGTFSGVPVSVRPTANDFDPDGDAVTLVSVDPPSAGSAQINADQSLTYTPPAEFSGSVSLVYHISDGEDSTSGTISIVVQGPSADGDGIDDETEAAAPNNGDGNNDGVPDADQRNVASVPVRTGLHTGQYLTLAADSEFGLEQVLSDEIPEPESAPTDATFPVGLVSFRLTGLPIGHSTVVRVMLPRGVEVVSWFMYGPTTDTPHDHWYEFPWDGVTGAVIFPESPEHPPMVDLHFTDGLRGDHDLIANGVIVDPGVPVLKTNRLPLLTSDVLAVEEDGVVTGYPLLNDVDPDGNPLTIRSVGLPSHGTIELGADGALTYTPSPNFFGSETVSYRVSDGIGASVQGNITFSVSPVPDAPIATDDHATTLEETAIEILFLENDFDVDGDAFFVTSVGMPDHGTAVYQSERTLIYSPFEDFEGTDSFTYTIADGTGLFAQGTITVVVEGSNDAPVGADDLAETQEDTRIELNVLGNDVDVDGDSLWVTSVTQPRHGALEVTAVGTIIYTPQPDYAGADEFRYSLTDGTATSSAKVHVTVAPVNDAPTWASPALSLPGNRFVIAADDLQLSYVEAQDVDDSALNYVYQLALEASFGTIILSRSAQDGAVRIAADELRPLLEEAGLSVTSDLTAYHRMVAIDPHGASGLSESQEVIFERGTAVGTESLEVPETYYLGSNYPNPFNPTTTLVFGLPEPADVRIEVYDVSGRHRKTVLSQFMAAGHHRIPIDLTELSTGVYLYRMQTQAITLSGTMSLVK